MGSVEICSVAIKLGVQIVPFYTENVLTSNDDLNNVKTSGLYCIADADTPSHCPSWGGMNSFVLVYNWSPYGGYSRFIQIMFDVNTGTVGYRTGSQDGFGNVWKQIQIVS